MSRGMWDFSSLTRNQTRGPGIGRQILNHWTTGEVPNLSDCCIRKYLSVAALSFPSIDITPERGPQPLTTVLTCSRNWRCPSFAVTCLRPRQSHVLSWTCPCPFHVLTVRENDSIRALTGVGHALRTRVRKYEKPVGEGEKA